MKYVKTFENFKNSTINEEFLFPKLSEIKAKAQEWLASNKDNPELQAALQSVRAEMAKLDPNTKEKIKNLSTESPEEIKAEVEPELVGESVINEGLDWKNILSKFFKILGIGTVTAGLITSFWAVITMAISGTGYTEMLGSTAGHVVGVGMITMLSALVPMIVSLVLKPEEN